MRSSETTFRGVVTHLPTGHQQRTVPGQPVPSSPATPAALPPRTRLPDEEVLRRARESGCCAHAGTGFVYKGTYLPSLDEYVAHSYRAENYERAIEQYKASIDRAG